MFRFITKLTFFSALITTIITCYIYPQYSRLVLTTLKSLLTSFSVKQIDLTTASNPSFGLKVSLIIVTFYFVQGLASLLTNTNTTTTRLSSKHTDTTKNNTKSNKKNNTNFSIPIPVHFLEIPLLLGIIVSAIAFIPPSLIQNYLTALSIIAPILPLLELFSIMTIIMESGKIWTPFINESTATFKIIVLVLCLGSYLLSSTVFVFIYSTMKISTLIASLLSSIITFVLVQTVACCKLEHATITDLSLIFPYISYNLLLITLRQVRPSTSGTAVLSGFIPKQQSSPFNYGHDLLSSFFFKSTSTSDSNPTSAILKQIIATFFSPTLIFHLIFQLAILVLTSKQTEDAEDAAVDEQEGGVLSKISRSFLKFSLQKLWPFYGKFFLVLIYTISWIDQFHPETFISTSTSPLSYLVSYFTKTPTNIDPSVICRWMVIFGAITWYSKHLIYDSHPDEATTSKYSCDKNYWNQFHNMK